MHTLQLWLICLIVLLTSTIEAQEVRPDVLWLRTGEKLEGKVSTADRDDLLEIILKDSGDTLFIKREDIERLEQNVVISSNEIRMHQRGQLPTLFNNKRTYAILQVVAGTGFGQGNIVGAGLRGGYRFSTGQELGLSLHYYGMHGWGWGWIPVGIETRLPLFKSKTGRFATLLQLNTGYAFSLPFVEYSEKYREFIKRGDGYFFQPGIAFRTNFTKNFGLMFDICYYNIRSPKKYWRNETTIGWDHEHFLVSRLGLFF